MSIMTADRAAADKRSYVLPKMPDTVKSPNMIIALWVDVDIPVISAYINISAKDTIPAVIPVIPVFLSTFMIASPTEAMCNPDSASTWLIPAL